MKRYGILIAVLLLCGMMVFSGCAAPASTAAGAKAQPSKTDPFSVQVKLTNQKDDKITIRTAIPVFSGFSAAPELNGKIEKLSQDGIREIKEGTKDLGDTAGADALYYASFFDYSRNGDLLSVWIMSENYSGGAHGMRWRQSFTLNTATGTFYTAPGALFRDEPAGTKWITDQISKKITEQKDGYFPEAQKTLTDKKGKYSFYLDGDTMVIYFDLYELMPYAAGMPEFQFSAKELAANGVPLKETLANASKRGETRLDGEDISMKDPVVSGDDGVFLPLEETVSLLGKKVTEQQGKYLVDGQAAEVKIIDGTAYSPLGYFTQTLGEFVVYDGSVLRIFPKTQSFVPMAAESAADSSAVSPASSKQNAMLIFPSLNAF